MNARRARFAAGLVLLAAATVAGCGQGQEGPSDPRAAAVDQAVRKKWGKPLDELPTVTLQVISPNNEDIQNEFEWAFSLCHAAEYGQKVKIAWRDVGGGGTAVLRYIINVYEHSKTSGLDVVWGGGEDCYHKLAKKDLLETMTLAGDVLANIPASFGGVVMYDKDHRWCGSAVSGFGFLYNVDSLKWAKIPPPTQWEDLARADCFDQICLSDPMQSSSGASAYEMIVQTAPTWPAGWAKLLGILGNAKKFVDSASGAANAPVLGEAPLAACIDFYGICRVAQAPEAIVYVSPKGQTAYNPDPIAILKKPPNRQLAQRFVDFVLSRRGQGLWALRVGQPDGPIRSPLCRQPIRRDVYEAYAGQILPRIVNPYETAGNMKIDMKVWGIRFGVLRSLVGAAAIENAQFLKAARKKLIETNFEPRRLAEFNRLPDDVDTMTKLAQVAKALGDKTRPEDAEKITSEWQRFFREKYQRVSE
jgi:iron(III) transport system substrate-binding protein